MNNIHLWSPLCVHRFIKIKLVMYQWVNLITPDKKDWQVDMIVGLLVHTDSGSLW